MIGQAVVQGLVRSKFSCQCTEKCHVMIKVASHISTGGNADDRLCTLKFMTSKSTVCIMYPRFQSIFPELFFLFFPGTCFISNEVCNF